MAKKSKKNVKKMKERAEKVVSESKEAVDKVKNEVTETASDAKDKVSSMAQKRGQIQVSKRLVSLLTWVAVIVATVVAVDYMIQFVNNEFSAAIVDGHRVSRNEVRERLEEIYGADITDQLIQEAIIEQEADKAGVDVSDDDVQAVVDETIESIGGEDEYKEALAAQRLTEDSYKRNIRLQLMAEQLVVPEVNEEDVRALYDEYKDTAYEGQEFDDVKEDVEDAYRSQEFNANITTWRNDKFEEYDPINNYANEPTYGVLKVVIDAYESLNEK